MRREREEEMTMTTTGTSSAAADSSSKTTKNNDQNQNNNNNNINALTYFFYSKEDLVWIHPKRGYPLWPAEVQEMNPKTHIVKATFICPPEESLASPVSIHASKLFYFDKFASKEAMDAEIERKLQRERFDVSKFEQTFRNAVSIANKLASCPLTPSAVREDMQFAVSPIGVVHSPFRSHCDAPRQPSTGAEQLESKGGVIRVAPELAQGLRDLKGFERIWVLFHFSFSEVEKSEEEEGKDTMKIDDNEKNNNDNDDDDNDQQKKDSHAASTIDPRFIPSTAYSTLIVPPRDTKQRGVFATRTPHRPNFIGLSCVRVLDVRGSEVHITDHDLLHGTPVLDIKPYLPFCDSHPSAKHGWVEALNRSGKGKGDHRPQGTTEYSLTRTRGLTLEKLTNTETTTTLEKETQEKK